MIARIWHGRTDASKADGYLAFVRRRAIPEYKSVPGSLGSFVLRRIDGDEAHFLTLSLWTSIDAVRGFAGDDVDRAKYYPEDREFLLELEPHVLHYEAYSTEE